MLIYLFNLLYLKTEYFSVQTRIIVTLLILINLITNSKTSLKILEFFYFSLIYTLIGQIYLDFKKFLLNKPFVFDDIYGYIIKIGLSYYCTYKCNLKLNNSGLCTSLLFMLYYKLNYNIKDIYDINFSENILILFLTYFILTNYIQ